MNELNKAELRRLAEAATGGDWEFRLGLIRTMVDSDGYVPVAIAPNCPKNWRGQRDTNMEYIAAANPSAVLSLLDECDSALAELQEFKNGNTMALLRAGLSSACDKRDAALAELEACRKEAERYRWLRDGESSKFLSIYACSMPFNQLDEAIDAAMSQEQSQ